MRRVYSTLPYKLSSHQVLFSKSNSTGTYIMSSMNIISPGLARFGKKLGAICPNGRTALSIKLGLLVLW